MRADTRPGPAHGGTLHGLRRDAVRQRGTGTPVLVLHGTPGGVDTADVMGRFLPSDRFRVVTVSRPGYLGTPVRHGRSSLDDDADRAVALLDRLGIDRVGLLAWSGGGPSAYRLAVRHPDRVSALVVAAGLSARWTPPHETPAEWFVTQTRPGAALSALAARIAPGAVVRAAIAGVSSLRGADLDAHVDGVLADPVRRRFVLDLAATGNASGPHRAGWRNDVANLGEIDSLELEAVRAPTLLLHGDADTDVLPEHSRRAATAIPGAELVTLPGGTHFALWDHEDAAAVQERVRQHLDR
ncbi:alpha/beta hydrolase [Curtobacterium sp. 'Ferrero']|uniref:alpha/beta fold hydrolase n=1 Tax=Curtobacterium sp. 'Ferrero' TaxID=2033654 RepID=UPI000BD7AFC8|nr:alpha/beta hydrolase [Curtobacterium sp. 'Ferrero']PCN48342.1 alpha/beta hydrolase [Curtobacterium sp. 'Ferrero']